MPRPDVGRDRDRSPLGHHHGNNKGGHRRAGAAGDPSQPPLGLSSSPLEQGRSQWIGGCKIFLRPTPSLCVKLCRNTSTTPIFHPLPSRNRVEIGYAKQKNMSRRRRRPLFSLALLQAARRQCRPSQAGRLFSRWRATLLPRRHPQHPRVRTASTRLPGRDLLWTRLPPATPSTVWRGSG